MPWHQALYYLSWSKPITSLQNKRRKENRPSGAIFKATLWLEKNQNKPADKKLRFCGCLEREEARLKAGKASLHF